MKAERAEGQHTMDPSKPRGGLRVRRTVAGKGRLALGRLALRTTRRDAWWRSAPRSDGHRGEVGVTAAEPARRKVSCRSEGEGAAGSGGGGGGAEDAGFSLPWQKKKGGGGGGGEDTEEALNKPNILWRVVSACMYFIPWIDAQQLSNYFYDQWSVLLPLYMVPAWPARLYCITPMAPLIWFFMLFSLVIRNKRLPHFLRFHTMQAMMTDIVVMLFGLTRQSLPYYIAGSWVDTVLSQYAFLCALLTVIWCIWKTLEGYYVELPFVSEAVYIQLSIADMM